MRYNPENTAIGDITAATAPSRGRIRQQNHPNRRDNPEPTTDKAGTVGGRSEAGTPGIAAQAGSICDSFPGNEVCAVADQDKRLVRDQRRHPGKVY